MSEREARFQVVSDLHLCGSRKTYELVPAADYLLICGDTENYVAGFFYLESFLARIAPLYKRVYWTLGNHECVSILLKSVHGIASVCTKIAARTGTVFLYNEACEVFPGCVVFGSPFFSCIPPDPETGRPSPNILSKYTKLVNVQKGLINKPVGVDGFNALHEEAKAALLNCIRCCKAGHQKLVVMTHFGPLAPYNNPTERALTFRCEQEHGYYSTDEDMAEILEEGRDIIKLWAFGHDHRNISFQYEYPDGITIPIVSNQLGNTKEPHVEKKFKKDYSLRVLLD